VPQLPRACRRGIADQDLPLYEAEDRVAFSFSSSSIDWVSRRTRSSSVRRTRQSFGLNPKRACRNLGAINGLQEFLGGGAACHHPMFAWPQEGKSVSCEPFLIHRARAAFNTFANSAGSNSQPKPNDWRPSRAVLGGWSSTYSKPTCSIPSAGRYARKFLTSRHRNDRRRRRKLRLCTPLGPISRVSSQIILSAKPRLLVPNSRSSAQSTKRRGTQGLRATATASSIVRSG
jgi:hypothetical protein